MQIVSKNRTVKSGVEESTIVESSTVRYGTMECRMVVSGIVKIEP